MHHVLIMALISSFQKIHDRSAASRRIDRRDLSVYDDCEICRGSHGVVKRGKLNQEQSQVAVAVKQLYFVSSDSKMATVSAPPHFTE